MSTNQLPEFSIKFRFIFGFYCLEKKEKLGIFAFFEKISEEAGIIW